MSSKVTDDEHARALANLYPDAAERVARTWPRGRLEARAASPRSSQALCVSVLETVAARPERRRRALLNAIAAVAGLGEPVGPAPQVRAEVRGHPEVLGETGAGTPTALDGLVTWSDGVIAIESKFAEPEFGGCGQVKPHKLRADDARYRPDQPNRRAADCNGSHAVGSDQKPTTAPLGAACRLTVKDGRRAPRRYWDAAPHLFAADVVETPRPCPFRDDAYQLMRNLAFAHQWPARGSDGYFAFLVCLVDRSPYAAALRRRVDEFIALLQAPARGRVGVISYEQIAVLLADGGEAALGRWVAERIAVALPPPGVAPSSEPPT